MGHMREVQVLGKALSCVLRHNGRPETTRLWGNKVWFKTPELLPGHGSSTKGTQALHHWQGLLLLSPDPQLSSGQRVGLHHRQGLLLLFPDAPSHQGES